MTTDLTTLRIRLETATDLRNDAAKAFNLHLEIALDHERDRQFPSGPWPLSKTTGTLRRRESELADARERYIAALEAELRRLGGDL